MTDTHPCAANGCKTQIPYHLLMCGTDWAHVPADLQSEVYRTYRRRSIDGWGPWVGARDAAIEAVEQHHRQLADLAPALFDVEPAIPPPPEPKDSPTVRRTKRQAADLARGRHPLTMWPLHAEAAPADDKKADGRRCGDCRFREIFGHHSRNYPKCTYGQGSPFVTHSEASDVRAWWPACRAHQYAEAAQ